MSFPLKHRWHIAEEEYNILSALPVHKRKDHFFDVMHPNEYQYFNFGLGIYGFELGKPENENGEFVIYLETGTHCD